MQTLKSIPVKGHKILWASKLNLCNTFEWNKLYYPMLYVLRSRCTGKWKDMPEMGAMQFAKNWENNIFFCYTWDKKGHLIIWYVEVRFFFSVPAWKNHYQSGLWNGAIIKVHNNLEKLWKQKRLTKKILLVDCFLSSNMAWAGIFISCTEFIHFTIYNKLLLCFLKRKKTWKQGPCFTGIHLKACPWESTRL